VVTGGLMTPTAQSPKLIGVGEKDSQGGKRAATWIAMVVVPDAALVITESVPFCMFWFREEIWTDSVQID
jgi:hypothetical protein